MIKNLKQEKYFGHTSTIEELRNLIGIKKEKMPMLYEKHGAKKISLRTYLRIEHGEEKFKFQRFQELANVFNKEFARKKINRVTDANLLFNSFGEKHFKETERKSFVTLVPVSDSSQVLNNLDRAEKKKVFGLSTLSPAAENDVEQIFECIKDFVNLKPDVDDESLTNFESEKNLMNVTTRLNGLINILSHTYGLKLYTGVITIPIFDFTETWGSVVETADPVTYDCFTKEVSYIIFYFSHNDEDEVEFTYHNDFSVKELKEFLIDKNGIQIDRDETLGVSRHDIRSKIVSKMNGNIEDILKLPVAFDRNKTSINPIYIREPDWKDDFENDLRHVDEISEQEQMKNEIDAQNNDDIEDETF